MKSNIYLTDYTNKTIENINKINKHIISLLQLNVDIIIPLILLSVIQSSTEVYQKLSYEQFWVLRNKVQNYPEIKKQLSDLLEKQKFITVKQKLETEDFININYE